jgi:thiol peroxidase
MATTALGDTPVHTVGEPPEVGSKTPAFELTGNDFEPVTLPEGTRVVLNIFPSVATGVCSTSVRTFNELAASLEDTTVINVSKDLPFVLASFCASEGIDKVVTASAFASSFGEDYGVTMVDGKWRGLLARTVVVVDRDGTVLHTQVTPAIGVEPDYDAAVAALG